VIIIFIGYTLHNNKQGVNCKPLMQKFDEYMTKSLLPIIENPDSLCHNFKIENPKRAIAILSIES
jgi:hypothetical protein